MWEYGFSLPRIFPYKDRFCDIYQNPFSWIFYDVKTLIKFGKTFIAQKMNFSIKDFLNKYDQIRRKNLLCSDWATPESHVLVILRFHN